MKKRKLLLAALAFLFILGIGSTIAYLTDTTDVKTNTFTIGGVEIELNEDAWDSGYGATPTALVPGQQVTKDPVIENTGDVSAYVFMKVVEPCVNGKKVFTYTINSSWSTVTAGTCSGDTDATSVYAYGSSSAMTELAEDATTPALFNGSTNQVTLNQNLDNTDIEELRGRDATDHTVDMTLTGYGIQKENVTGTPSSIWGANFS